MDALLTLLAKCFGHSLGLPPQYSFIKRIGQGAEGDVWLCTDEERSTMVAAKLVHRGPPTWRLQMVGREGRMLTRLGFGHVNIVRPLEIVLTSRHLAFISEYVPGGSLSDYLMRSSMDEDTARYFFKQLLAAIRYLHSRKLVYRDIKPANLLITSTRPPFLKLCDFGLAHTWVGKDKPVFETLAGTPGYMSPEIMTGFFEAAADAATARKQTASAASGGTAPPAGAGGGDPAAAGAAAAEAGAANEAASRPSHQYDGVKADVYSAGVMLVVMLLHTMPYHYNTYAARLPPLEAMRKIWQLEVLQGVQWREATSQATKLSEPLAALLDRMLEPNVSHRAGLEEVAASEWVNLPLPPKLQAALDILQEQQETREAAAAAAASSAAELGSPGPDAVVEERLELFDSMLTAAQERGRGLQLEQRLVLAPVRQHTGPGVR